MATAEIGGTTLFYRDVGSGPPCLMMHGGLGGDHRSLSPWLDALAARWRLIYYDHRGCGRSGRPPVDSITFERLCADADDLRAHLGVERTAVLGVSYGGFIALEYALRYPDRMSQLILIGTAPAFKHGDEVAELVRRKGATEEMVQALATPMTDDATMRRVMNVITPLYYHRYDAELAKRHMGPTRWSAAAYNQGDHLLQQFDVRSRLRDIRAPTLVTVGRDDFICPPSQAEIMHHGIPGSKLVVFEHSGHFPFVEEPEAFMSAVGDWLNDAI